MNLCDDRNTIIKLFEDKNIKPSDYPYNATSEELEEKSESESESESEFEESITERTKLGRQEKSNKQNP